MATSELCAAEPAHEQSRRGRLAKLLRRCLFGGGRRNARGFVSVGIIVITLTAMSATLFGAGVVSRALDLHDGAIWFWDSGHGDVARVNTSAGRVDMRRSLSDSLGHRVNVIQSDQHVLLQDLDTGTVTSLDLATLNASGVTTLQRPADMRIGLLAGNTLIVDAAKGLVSQLDAGSFKPSGMSLKTPKNLVGGDFDDKGRFWVGSPDTGEAISIKPGSRGKGPSIERKVNVGHKGRPWMVGVLDDGVVIVDSSSSELIAVNGGGASSKITTPAVEASATMPTRIRGGVIPITNPDNRNVIVVQGSDVSHASVAKGVTARALPISGSGKKLGAAIAFSNRLYIPDEDANLVRVIDLEGKNLGDINTDGRVEMESRENHLLINSENTDRAWVINEEHKVTELQKISKDVAAGASSGVGPQTSTPASSQDTKAATPPSSVDKEGLKASPSPSRSKPSPKPTEPPAVAPNAPVIVRVLGNKDGSVTIEWDAPNANGGTLQSYDVYASGPSARTFSGIHHVDGQSLQRMMIEPAALAGGASNYTFTVVARSTNGATSNPSAPSPITRFEP